VLQGYITILDSKSQPDLPKKFQKIKIWNAKGILMECKRNPFLVLEMSGNRLFHKKWNAKGILMECKRNPFFKILESIF